jgi:hypothetical protein
VNENHFISIRIFLKKSRNDFCGAANQSLLTSNALRLSKIIFGFGSNLLTRFYFLPMAILGSTE